MVYMHVDDMQEVKDTLITKKMTHFNPKWITEMIVDAGPEACASFLTPYNVSVMRWWFTNQEW